MISTLLVVICNYLPILANDYPADNKTRFYRIFKEWNEVLP
jgi:hypothetical protein